jgi:hypothetical protein
MANSSIRLYYNGGLTGKNADQPAYVVSKGNPLLLPAVGSFLEVSAFTARDIMRNYNVDSDMFTLGSARVQPGQITGAPAAVLEHFSKNELEEALQKLVASAPKPEPEPAVDPAVPVISIRKGAEKGGK